MPFKTLLRHIHHLIEAKHARRITQKEMAQKLEISHRTYTEYLRGTNQPMGMLALLDLLCELEPDDQIKVLSRWKKNRSAN